ncbi:MAG: DUF2157 domain-containing protein [Deltaproteobacteria bacterium]|nr:DUF2157 domain-containing protein [Deltaproteobacteria bacterium]
MKFIKLFKKELADQINEWVQAGLISEQQAQKISAYENLDFQQPRIRVGILRVIAAIAVGLGIIVLLEQNWHSIPKILRILILTVSTLVTQTLGIKRKLNNLDYGTTLIIISALLFGATIFLTGQMYHLGLYFEKGYLLWGLGTALTGIATNVLSVSIISSVSLWLWLVFETSEWFILYPLVALPNYFHCFKRDSLTLHCFNLFCALSFFSELLKFLNVGDFEYLIFFLSLLAIGLAVGDRFEKTAIGSFTKIWSFRGILFLVFLGNFNSFWKLLYADSKLLVAMQFILLVFMLITLVSARELWVRIGSICYLLGLISIISSKLAIGFTTKDQAHLLEFFALSCTVIGIVLGMLILYNGFKLKNLLVVRFGAFYSIIILVTKILSESINYTVVALLLICSGLGFLWFEKWIRNRLSFS